MKQKMPNITACVLSLATTIVYSVSVSREHSPLVIGLLVLATLVEALLIVKPIRYLEYLPFASVLCSAVVFIRLAFDEVGDVLGKVNMNGLSATWIASAVLLVLSMIALGVTTVTAKREG